MKKRKREEEGLENEGNLQLRIKDAYCGLSFPPCLMHLFKLAVSVNEESPVHALQNLGLTLTGPFNVLSEKDYTMVNEGGECSNIDAFMNNR
jgi:hypothetical protein